MDELAIRALYASVVEDEEEGFLFIGFAEGEDDSEPYVLLRQPLTGGSVWFEVSDESLGAEDAVAQVRLDDQGLTFVIAPEKVAKLGGAQEVQVRLSAATEDGDQAVTALREMFGSRFEG